METSNQHRHNCIKTESEPKFDPLAKIIGSLAIVPPLILLIIGGLIGWALAGFKSSTKTS